MNGLTWAGVKTFSRCLAQATTPSWNDNRWITMRLTRLRPNCCLGSNEVYDFLGLDNCSWTGDIITNPPYRLAVDFVYKALRVIPGGNKVAMFLRLQFLEGKSRKDLFARFPPKVIYVSSSRILCAKNGDFARMQAAGGSAVAYAWFVWVKGLRQPTIVKWIN